MDLVIIFNALLVKTQPLLSILGLTGAVASVQLATLLAVTVISTIAIISIVRLMVYGWKKITQKGIKPDSDEIEDPEIEDPDLQEEEVLDEAFDFEQNSDLEPPEFEPLILPQKKHSNVEEPQAKIQAAPGASGYKPEPKIIGEYYDTLETIVAIHAYRDLCLHIEKTIIEPSKYAIQYKVENNHLTAYLHSPDSIIKINVDNIFLELNGRFDVVLKLLKKWNIDFQNIGILQKHLSMPQDSIRSSYAYEWNNDRRFHEYTANFWGADGPCRLLNSFIWSNPSVAHPYCNTSPHNISLLIIMPIALTKYLSMLKDEPSYRSNQTLQRTEGNFCSYTPGDVIDCKIFRPFSQIHPADTPISNRFDNNPNFLVLKNYIGGQLADSPFPNEREVVITTDILITVTEIMENCTERRYGKPYRKITMSASAKTAIADVYLIHSPKAILANLFDKEVGQNFTKTKTVLNTILEYTGLPSKTKKP